MIIKIDFNSDEAIYMQLRNQIILGIAMNEFRDGDQLPSVRALADTIGINMHTVNKAYTVLRQEGFVKVDRRKGACVSIDADHLEALRDLEQSLSVVLARAYCRHVTREEAHKIVDKIYDRHFSGKGTEEDTNAV